MVIGRLQTAVLAHPTVACWCDSRGLEHAGAELTVDLLKSVMHFLTSSQTSSLTSGCDVRSLLCGGGKLQDVHATSLLCGTLTYFMYHSIFYYYYSMYQNCVCMAIVLLVI